LAARKKESMIEVIKERALLADDDDDEFDDDNDIFHISFEAPVNV